MTQTVVRSWFVRTERGTSVAVQVVGLPRAAHVWVGPRAAAAPLGGLAVVTPPVADGGSAASSVLIDGPCAPSSAEAMARRLSLRLGRVVLFSDAVGSADDDGGLLTAVDRAAIERQIVAALTAGEFEAAR